MEKGENRKLFLNVKATLDSNANISNIDIPPDDNYYSMSCDFYNGNKLAFGIKKVDGVAFAKACVQSGNIPDSELVEICDKICGMYMQIVYSIHSGKIIFQMVIPVQKDTFEENDNMVFNEFKLFVEAITECCNILGTGNVIHLKKKQYIKRQSGNVMQISPDTNIEYEDAVRKEMNAKEKSSHDDTNKEEDDNFNMQQTVKVDDFDIEPEREFDGINQPQVNVEDVDSSFYFSGSMPVEMMDDGYNDDYNDTDDETPIIKSDDIPEINKDNNDTSVDIGEYVQEMNKPDNQTFYSGKTGFNKAGSSNKNSHDNTNGSVQHYNHTLKENTTSNSSNANLEQDNSKQNARIPEKTNRPQNPDNKKQKQNTINTSSKNNIKTKNNSYDEKKSVEKKIIEEKESNKNRENDIKNERNKTMQPIGKNFSEREKSMDKNESKNRGRVSIFLRYEQDITNLDNKYKDIIKKMELDELLKVIESHYADCTDNNGNVVHVEEHTKEALCNLAKDELKNRIGK